MKSKLLLLAKETDFLTGIVLMIVGGTVYLEAIQIAHPPVGVLVGTDFFPKAASLVMLLLGVLQLSLFFFNKYLRKSKNGSVPQGKKASETAISIRGPLLSCLLLCVYMFLLEAIGFLVLTPLYLVLQILILSPPGRRRYILFGVIAVIISVILYVIFVYGLFVLLPSGILG